jgi:GNAT superfamily N-acetyltransferase
MPNYPLADTALARRIESACVLDLCAYADASRASGVYPDAVSFRVGGGAAVWFSPRNVVNGSFGLGMNRSVEAEEIAALIAFFDEHEAPARTDVCPHADRSVLRWLAEAGFVATDFEMVLFQPLPASAPCQLAEGVSVLIAHTPEERTVWADLEARGFTDEKVTDDHRVLSRAISLREDALHFTGYLNGQPAGTGMLALRDGLAMFNGDSTLPAARNRGVQSSILAERLRYAREAGCDLAVIEATPGGVSQRNQERAGFRTAYTRVTLERPART